MSVVGKKMENKIEMFIHCKKCVKERGEFISPRDYASLEFGYTKKGFQLWCVRHDENVLAIDLLEQKVAYDN
tara:strand:+ start:395 stop:610 length:216 start_codon:yes stop_codon:yes gene_type:complete